MTYRLGVDLGTTFTTAAVARTGTPATSAEAIPLGDHGPEIPSIALLSTDGRLLFGARAVAGAEEHPDRVAREFKRRIGDSTGLFLGGTPMSSHGLTGELLGWVVEQVARGQGTGPDEVVVTCPANWGPYRRELLEQAVSISGLTDARICTEPEAAAIHFASTGRLSEGDAIAVYDLGGGTFDAAVLRLNRHGFSFCGRPEGIEQLGGLDFDDAVFGHVQRSLQLPEEMPDDPEVLHALRRLRGECVAAKELLSHQTAVTIHVGLPGVRPTVRMTRAELEDLIAPSIHQTVDCLERVVDHAELSAADLSAVVLVGGSARIPLVSEQVTRRLGRPVAISPHPKLCVSMGAALLPTPTTTQAPTTGAIGDRSPFAPAEGRSAPGARAGGEWTPFAPGEERITPGNGAGGDASTAAGSAGYAGGGGLGPAVPGGGVGGRRSPSASGSGASGERSSFAVGGGSSARGVGGGAGVRGLGRRGWFGVGAVVLLVVGVGVAVFGATSGVVKELRWDVEGSRTAVMPVRTAPTAELTPTFLGVELPGDPIKLDRATRTFEIGDGYKVFLAGPVVGVVDPPGDKVLLKRSGGAWWSPFATIPGGAMILGFLFSFAYAESLLRELRSQRGRIRAGQLIGMIGVGVITGLVAALATWIGGRLLTPVSAVLVVVCIAAAAGLLAFAAQPSSER